MTVDLEAQLEAIQLRPNDDVLASARALSEEAATAEIDGLLRWEIAIAWAGRAIEGGAWDDASEAAAHAQMLADQLPPEVAQHAPFSPSAVSARARAAALIGARQLQDGFALLDTVFTTPGMPFVQSRLPVASKRPIDRALTELATLAQEATRGDDAWIGALVAAHHALLEGEEADVAQAAICARWARPEPTGPEKAMLEILDRLRADESLAVEPSFDEARTADAMLRALEKARTPERAIEGVANAILYADGVEELFANNETVGKLLQTALGAPD